MGKRFLNWLVNIVFIFFIIELVLGFNGRFLVIGNIPIRQIFFGFAVVGGSFKLYSVLKNSRFSNELCVSSVDKYKYFINCYFSGFDKMLFLFLMLNLIWVILVPFFTSTSIKLSIKEVLCVNVVLLYFPLVILIKLERVNWKQYRSIIKWSVFSLALIHIIFYIGEKIVGDATFVLNIFKGIQRLTSGHTIRPIVMMPDSSIRIIYPASIYLILTFYFTVDSKQSIRDNILTFLGVFALCTTVTKSLFLGVALGVASYFSMLFYKNIRSKHKLEMSKISKFFVVILLSTIILNYTVFDNYIFMRLTNPFAIATKESQEIAQKIIEGSIATDKNIHDIKELAGTERSNRTRLEQIKQLISTWKQKPLLGWGYGSLAGNYLRSDNDTPYSYEMVGVALLMKIGLIGILIWIMFILYLCRHILKKLTVRDNAALKIIYAIVALGVSTQFNPFLFNSSGMSILLFCFIEMKNIELEANKLSADKA